MPGLFDVAIVLNRGEADENDEPDMDAWCIRAYNRTDGVQRRKIRRHYIPECPTTPLPPQVQGTPTMYDYRSKTWYPPGEPSKVAFFAYLKQRGLELDDLRKAGHDSEEDLDETATQHVEIQAENDEEIISEREMDEMMNARREAIKKLRQSRQ